MSRARFLTTCAQTEAPPAPGCEERFRAALAYLACLAYLAYLAYPAYRKPARRASMSTPLRSLLSSQSMNPPRPRLLMYWALARMDSASS